MGSNILFEVMRPIFINQHEEGRKFAVYVFGTAVRARHATARDHYWTDEASVDVLRFPIVRVVQPHDGAVIFWARTGALRRIPHVSVRRREDECCKAA